MRRGLRPLPHFVLEGSGLGTGRVGEVAAVFLRLGATAFGGPAAHIGLMQEEVVERRKWVDRQTFLDLLGATNLIPGPNSTELAMHLGYVRAGLPGLVVGGACFILPAMAIVLALAWAYVAFGALPQAGWLLYGVKPVILAIVGQALWNLRTTAVKGWPTGLAFFGMVAGMFLGAPEIPLLFGLGLLVMLWQNRGCSSAAVGGVVPFWGLAFGVEGASLAGAVAPTLGGVALFFLKVGSVLYGSGYVLLAFLQNDLVERWGWLTSQQLLDAVAVGQFTPGPLFTTATFIGYVLGGWQGGLVATVAIFLPGFFFVGLLGPLLPRLRKSRWVAGFLEGVNAASLGLMAWVAITLGRGTLVDWQSVALGLVALGLLLRFRKVNSAWWVAAGGVAGWLLRGL
ncbi:MAG TPA: chromate efflux transporter [Symbiobacteriaceae bacterium]|nr:chromate efflux transporter [Symbiobacteriaceae bacterium]